MYKIVLPCFVIVSCFVFYASGQDVSTIQESPTDCKEFQTCNECVDNSLNCTFCSFPQSSSDICTNSTVCPKDSIPARNKSQCPSVSPTISTPSPTPMPDTTPAPVTTSKTETPTTEFSSDASESTTSSKPSPAPSGRHFDPPSFIGGTVLSLGLLAIVYVGFKFYKARTERNYHTL